MYDNWSKLLCIINNQCISLKPFLRYSSSVGVRTRYKTVLSFLYSLAFGIALVGSYPVLHLMSRDIILHQLLWAFGIKIFFFGFSLSRRWVPFALRSGGLQLCFTRAPIVSVRRESRQTSSRKKEGLQQ